MRCFSQFLLCVSAGFIMITFTGNSELCMWLKTRGPLRPAACTPYNLAHNVVWASAAAVKVRSLAVVQVCVASAATLTAASAFPRTFVEFEDTTPALVSCVCAFACKREHACL